MVFFPLCKSIKRLNVEVSWLFLHTNPAQLEVTENHLGADNDFIFLLEKHFVVLFYLLRILCCVVENELLVGHDGLICADVTAVVCR